MRLPTIITIAATVLALAACEPAPISNVPNLGDVDTPAPVETTTPPTTTNTATTATTANAVTTAAPLVCANDPRIGEVCDTEFVCVNTPDGPECVYAD